MVIATDKPLVTKDNTEHIVMGSCSLSEEFRKLSKYECPYKFGDISNAISDVSCMNPEELEEL